MSAVFGLFRFDGQPVNPIELDRMNAALTAHGPDRHGIWIDRHVGLGHRLTRFTPEDDFERQPMVASFSRLCLVSDGRIDNRPELMSELSIPLSEAGRMPDSAFILRAYEKWGQECPTHLIGAFAFALYDVRENSLLLARSPRGERSLFYHVSDRAFAFSTAPKGLFALSFVPRKVNCERIADLLAIKQPDSGSSFFSGVHRLRQGYSVLVRPEGLKSARYWRLNPGPEIRFPRDDDYVEAFQALFDRVVADTMRSRSPVGVMMSGGFDSTSVAAIAADRIAAQGGRVAAYTEVPPPGFSGRLAKGRYADETPFAMAMARRFPNLDVNFVRTGGRFFLEGIDRFFDAAEVPFRNASNRVWWEAIHEQAALQGVRVLLTGVLGNLTISWAGSGVMPALLKSGKWNLALREARSLVCAGSFPSTIRAIGVGAASLFPQAIWGAAYGLRHPKRPIFHGGVPWHSYSAIRPQFAKQYRLEDRAREIGHSFRPRPGGDYRTNFLQTRDDGGDVSRGHEAMFGVQTRDPANDQRMLDFCLAIPEDQYLREGTSRWLLRRAMANRLPSEILSNPLRGLQAGDWLQRFIAATPQIREELELLEQCDLAREAVDLPRLRNLVQTASTSGRNMESMEFRALLDIGLMTGRFLRWAESGL